MYMSIQNGIIRAEVVRLNMYIYGHSKWGKRNWKNETKELPRNLKRELKQSTVKLHLERKDDFGH